jgi:carbon monoxide dehydrogenase subunit G
LPRSTFHRELSVSSTPEHTWRTLTDVPQLVEWISIVEGAVELEPLARYQAILMDRLGPFKLRADLDIVLSDVVVGRSLKVKASGEDRQVGSRLLVEVAMTMDPHDSSGTDVAFNGFYEVTGRAAAMGTGTINKKADKVMEEFFSAASASLGAV